MEHLFWSLYLTLWVYVTVEWLDEKLEARGRTPRLRSSRMNKWLVKSIRPRFALHICLGEGLAIHHGGLCEACGACW
jgi:hypothetical protein